MLAVFNKRKDSIKTDEEAWELEREINSLYISDIKKMYKRMCLLGEEVPSDWGTFDWDRVYCDPPFMKIQRKYFDVISKVRDIRRKY